MKTGMQELKRCSCGAVADLWVMELTRTYTVRCSECQHKTRPHTTVQGAENEWNTKAWKGEVT